jgi:AAA15 family ATPase/GTPase
MSELLLDSLEIKGYRCFEHLTIEKLGRVNLIVGKNNVGKTAFLEALWAFSRNGDVGSLIDSLFSRNELSYEIVPGKVSFQKEHLISSIRNLFYKRPTLHLDRSESLFIGNEKSYLKTSISSSTNSKLLKDFLSPPSIGLVLYSCVKDDSSSKENLSEVYSLEMLRSLLVSQAENKICEFNRFQIQNKPKFVELWDYAVSKSLEDGVKRFLQILLPSIDYINFVGTANNTNERIPIVNNGHSSERVPLSSFGDGMIKILEIALSLVKCQNGIFLVDEIESGFHYSVLPDVWKLIFKTAKDLNVQVFATTHSKDCIEAFTQAAIDDEESEGMLIRLERNKSDKIIAKTIEEENLALAIDYGAEVR